VSFAVTLERDRLTGEFSIAVRIAILTLLSARLLDRERQVPRHHGADELPGPGRGGGRFEDNILDHSDAGMIANMRVLPKQGAISHREVVRP
jgi:hypothetical protein